MTAPLAVVIGLDPGAVNVGVCVWLSTPAGPEVLEAATEELAGAGPLAVADLARRAVATARAITADHADRIATAAAALGVDVPETLWCVESMVIPRRETQQQRAVAGTTKVLTAVMTTNVCLGALLALLDGETVQMVAPAGWDHREGGPACLRGRHPAGWRSRIGSERQHQRSAYFLSQEGLRVWLAAGNTPARATAAVPDSVLPVPTRPAPEPARPVTPVTPHSEATKPVPAAREAFCCIDNKYGLPCPHTTASPVPAQAVVPAASTRVDAPARVFPGRPDVPVDPVTAAPVGYLNGLIALIRAADPASVPALLVAAEDAISLLPVPDGETVPGVGALALIAVTEHGIAPLIRLLPDLLARLNTTTSRRIS